MPAKPLKQLELLHKTLWDRVCRRLLASGSTARAAELAEAQSVVFLRYDRIGDMLVSTPVFTGLKAMNPHMTTAVVASPANAPIACAHPDIDRVHVLRPGRPIDSWHEIKAARCAGYDAVVNLNLNPSLTGALLARWVCPNGVKVAATHTQQAAYYDVLAPIERDNRRSMVELLLPFLQMFGELPDASHLKPRIGIDPADQAKVLAVLARLGIRKNSAGSLAPYLAINLSARRPVTRWPEASYIDLLRLLTTLGDRPDDVVVFGDPADRGRTERIAGALGGAVHRFPPTRNVMEIAALVKWATAVVTPDTSIVHFASATQTPVAGLFATQEFRPMEWQPYGIPHRSIFAREGRPVAAITPVEVFEQVVDLLAEVWT